MNGSRWSGVLSGLVALALLGSGAAQGGDQAKLPAAKTPEEAIKNVLAACKVGDLNLLLDQIGEPVRSQMQALMLREVARDELLEAIHDKFGKDPKAIVPFSVKESLQQRKEIVIRKKEEADKGTYRLTVWLTEERVKGMPRILEYKWLAVQEAGNWKILFDLGGGSATPTKMKGPDGKEVVVRVIEHAPVTKEFLQEVEYMKKVAPKMRALVNQLVKDIKSGVYKDRLEAEKAIQVAERRFVEENPPPFLEKKDPKKKNDEKK